MQQGFNNLYLLDESHLMQLLIDCEKGKPPKELIVKCTMEKDMSNEYVPFVYVELRNKHQKEDAVLYVDKNRGFFEAENSNPVKESFECCIWAYDTSLKSVLIDMLAAIYQRLGNENQTKV